MHTIMKMYTIVFYLIKVWIYLNRSIFTTLRLYIYAFALFIYYNQGNLQKYVYYH